MVNSILEAASICSAECSIIFLCSDAASTRIPTFKEPMESTRSASSLETFLSCNSQDLLRAEQKWIAVFATTEHGYNIHPTPIAPDYTLPAAATTRLKQTFVGTSAGRGTMTEAGRIAKERAMRLTWDRPGEREYRGERMREAWTIPEHRAKIDAANAERLADPDELQAMRDRMAAVSARRTPETRRADIVEAWWRRYGSDRFKSNAAMDDWIVEQYNIGVSVRQIGLALGMAHNAVASRLRARDVVMPARGSGREKLAASAMHLARKGIYNVVEFDRQVAVLYTEGNSANAIRLTYGLSADAIRASLRRSGIPLRGRSSSRLLRSEPHPNPGGGT
jgi:hypothetical protein